MRFPPVPGASQVRYPYGVRYPDQLPALEYGLLGTAGITALQVAIANRNNARVDIPVIGDSITEGQGASVPGNRWIGQANRAVRAAYPTTANGSSGGLGFIPAASTGETSYAWPVAQVGGAGWNLGQPVGPVRAATAMNAAGSLTFTAPAGTTSVRVMYYNNGDGSQFSWKVGAGAATTVTVSGNTGDGALTVSIPVAAAQVLTIAWVAGTVYLEGIVHYAGDETAGITFHGCGHFGWQAGQQEGNAWNQAGFGAGFAWQPSIAALIPGAGAVGVMLGVNDAAAYAAVPFAANMATLIAGLRGVAALASIPLLLIAPYQPSEVVVDPGGWPAYVSALRSVAAADQAGAHVIDLSYRMPSVASGWTGGELYSDAFHPTNLGHALIGEIAAAGPRIA